MSDRLGELNRMCVERYVTGLTKRCEAYGDGGFVAMVTCHVGAADRDVLEEGYGSNKKAALREACERLYAVIVTRLLEVAGLPPWMAAPQQAAAQPTTQAQAAVPAVHICHACGRPM